jgi:hypothetical protein
MASGPCLLEIEDIVQELMKACILAVEPSLSAALRTVLGGFHNQKHVRCPNLPTPTVSNLHCSVSNQLPTEASA